MHLADKTPIALPISSSNNLEYLDIDKIVNFGFRQKRFSTAN